ncbi:MAG: HD domain-containing protein [Candidatus Portnoybacteria bacterium]|nr:HD domain-containing protein [Candidatus Portnoybacteria bacterium]
MEIPKEVKNIIQKLEKNGFEAYVVGGCVRDLLLGLEPNDWDIATSAKPEEMKELFSDSYYENQFLTVTVLTKSKHVSLKEIEVTTFRSEAKYSDKRHPDEVRAAGSLKEDLARRDFTINAVALKIQNSEFAIIDPFEGREDIERKIIRAVGKAEERFGEDALRLMRAIRLASVLNFKIEKETFEAIKKNAGWLQVIAKERIREELVKMIMSDRPAEGIELLREAELLKYIIPELEKGVGVSQNRHHIYTVYEHCLHSLKFAAEKKFNLEVRLAALLHDIAKPQAKAGEGPDSTFYNHDFLSAKFAARILERLRFSNNQIEKICLLIRNHMFVYEVGVVTEAAVRRLLRRVGPENMKDLINVRVADRLGSGVPKAQPYRLRHFQYMVEKVQHDPISAKMLKVDGNDLMGILKIEPGPKIGAILDVLLAEVIEDPEKNKKECLEKRVLELANEDLVELRKMAKGKIEEKKEEEDTQIKGKYWVK